MYTRTRAIFRRLAVAALALVLPRWVEAQAQLPPFVEMRVAKAPTVVTAKGTAMLVHELHVTNLQATPLTLSRLEVLSGEADGRVVLALEATMHRAGVRILTGTDAPLRNSPPGFGLHEELALLARGGLTPFEILRAATLEPARFLGMLDSAGTIAPGKLADLVLLDANPLLDIRNTRRIAVVVANGVLYGGRDRETLLRSARCHHGQACD